MFEKNKEIIYLVTWINQNLVLIKKFKYNNLTVNQIKFKQKTYILDLGKPTIIDRNRYYYFININDGTQLIFNKIKGNNINVDLVDTIVSRNIVKQLTSSMSKNDTSINILWLILGAVMGAMATYSITTYLYQQKMTEFMQNYNSNTPLFFISLLRRLILKW